MKHTPFKKKARRKRSILFRLKKQKNRCDTYDAALNRIYVHMERKNRFIFGFFILYFYIMIILLVLDLAATFKKNLLEST